MNGVTLYEFTKTHQEEKLIIPYPISLALVYLHQVVVLDVIVFGDFIFVF